MDKLIIKTMETKAKRFYLFPKTRFLLVVTIIMLLISLLGEWFALFENQTIAQNLNFILPNKQIQIGILCLITFLFMNLFLFVYLKKESKVLLILLILMMIVTLLSTIFTGFTIYRNINFLAGINDYVLIKQYIVFTVFNLVNGLILLWTNILFVRIITEMFIYNSKVLENNY